MRVEKLWSKKQLKNTTTKKGGGKGCQGTVLRNDQHTRCSSWRTPCSQQSETEAVSDSVPSEFFRLTDALATPEFRFWSADLSERRHTRQKACLWMAAQPQCDPVSFLYLPVQRILKIIVNLIKITQSCFILLNNRLTDRFLVDFKDM